MFIILYYYLLFIILFYYFLKFNLKIIRLHQECFNSPYGTQYFADYAEQIPGESTNMLSSVAKETGCYIIGGSIPESDSDGKLYNTSTSFGPDGAMLAKHRKVRTLMQPQVVVRLRS